MNDSLTFIIIIAVLMLGLCLLMGGEKIGKSGSYENCINYYSDQSVKEARILCDNIVLKGKNE